MNKSLLLSGISLSIAAMPSFAQTAKKEPSRAQSAVRVALKKANKHVAEINASEVARTYKPQIVRYQYYQSYDSIWGDMNEEKYAYNTDGTVKTMEIAGQKTQYTYNADGKVVKEEVYSEYDNDTKLVSETEYTYDPVVKDLVVTQSQKYYEGHSTPVYSSTSGVEITRNSDGNITLISDYRVGGDNKIEYTGDQLIIEYGADKKAVKITEQGYEYNDQGQQVPYVYQQLSDIVWDTTDGQITTIEFDDLNADMYFSANRIASATITDDEWPRPATFTATYDGDSYHSLVKMGDERLLEIDFKCIEKFAPRENFEDCYSYEATTYEVDYDSEDNGQYYIDYSSDTKETNTADAFGNCLLNERTSVYHYKDGDETYTESERTDVIYDTTVGYPIQAAHWTKNESDKDYQPTSLYFYDDYVNLQAAVNSVEADSADSPAEYYNLQGVRVQNPDHGLYIVRQGSTVSKVLVK